MRLSQLGKKAVPDRRRRLSRLYYQIAGFIVYASAGVVAWSREADPAIGEYGPPVVLFQAGEIPEPE